MFTGAFFSFPEVYARKQRKLRQTYFYEDFSHPRDDCLKIERNVTEAPIQRYWLSAVSILVCGNVAIVCGH